MSTFRLTDAYWPLLITAVPPRIEVPALREYMARIDGYYRRRERFATLVDTSAVENVPSADARAFVAEWQNQTIDSIRMHNVVNVTVVTSAVVRGAMTAMNWIFRPPNEQLVVGAFDEGLDTCIDRLRAERGEIPPALVLFAARARPLSVEAAFPRASIPPPRS